MRPSHRRGDDVAHAVEHLERRQLLAATLLVDINSTTASSNALEPVVLGGRGYFFANDGNHGYELWKTDGTAADTSLVRDINPGPGGSGGFSLEAAGGLLYFPANDSTGRVDLWRSDGTAEGTFKLTNVATSNDQFLIGELAELNGAVYFGTNQWGVWGSDGTVTGTVRIAPIYSSSIARLGGALYFYGPPQSGGGNSALWRTDGTSEGTHEVRQFADNYNTTVRALNGRLYFWAADDSLGAGREPWSSDGTPEGTVPLGDLAAGAGSSSPLSFTTFNGAVYFKAAMPTDPPTARLYRTDGTAGGTTLIADVGRSGSDYGPGGFIAYGGAMYFSGYAPATGSELWRSDGTGAGTGPFIDLNPGSEGSGAGGFAIHAGRLYFRAVTAATGAEIFSTDGTVAGTRLLMDIAPGQRGSNDFSTELRTFNGRLYFRADDLVHGRELWSSDGTTEGTALFKDINSWTKDSNPGPMTAGPGGFHYFLARDGQHPINDGELWRTDGTAAGTSIVRDVVTINPYEIESFTYLNGLLLFGAYSSAGFELWRSDGTEAGTHLVKDIAPGNTDGFADPIVKVGDRAFFAAKTASSNQYGLWTSDGTEEGTHLVKPWDNYFALERFSGIEHAGKLLFLASTYTPAEWTEASIYMSDGTLEGTTLVKAGFRNNPAGNWTEFNGHAYFTADAFGSGNELWRSDGTEQGTVMLGDINPGAGGSSPGNLVATSDYLYFTATNRTFGRELWRVGAQQDQPQRLTTLAGDVDQVQRAAAGRGVIFTTTAGDLYRFDGANLIALKPAGAFSGAPALLGSDRWFDYFRAGTDATGDELWKTDGTAAGTVLVQDLVPGPLGSYPTGLGVINGKVIVAASVPEVGRELFVFPSFGAQAEDPVGPPVALSRGLAASTMPRIIDLLKDDLGQEGVAT